MGTDVVAIAGLVVSGVTLLFVIGGGFYWWGRLSNRVDTLDKRVDELSGKVDGVRGELSGKIDRVRDEVLAEMRRSEERILTALANHSHVNPEAGPPVFWHPLGYVVPAQPPGSEAATAPREGVETPAD